MEPFIEINWEESDVCLFLTCKCGKESHFDQPSISDITCRACRKVYKLPQTFGLEKGLDNG